MSAVRNKLPRKLCLKGRLEIAALFSEGQRFSGRCCTLLWQPGTDFRYGVFVSRKLGKATVRVRIKRLYREAIRKHRHELTDAGRLGVLPSGGGRIPDWKEIDNEVRRLIGKISLSH